MTFSIPAWKQDHLEADLRYFQADVKYQMCDSVEKMKGNRSFTFKLLNIIKRLPTGANLTMNSLLSAMEFMKDFQVVEYKIEHHDSGFSTAVIEINDNYFMLVDMVKPYIPFISSYGKSGLAKKLEKEMRKTYDREAIITVK